MTSAAASATTVRDLGPDPGAAAYRALDVCGLVPAAEIHAVWGATEPTAGSTKVVVRSSSPGGCLLDLGQAGWSARVSVASSRPDLPAEVRTTDLGIDQAVELPHGLLIHDPACRNGYAVGAAG